MKFMLVAFFISFFSSHAFAEGLYDSLQAAIAGSDQDHKQQQVAFKVHPAQVEKATFKKANDLTIVQVQPGLSSNMSAEATDSVSDLRSEEAEKPEAVNTAADMADDLKEVSDIR